MGNLSKINLNALLILGILAPNFRQLYSCVGGGGSGGGTVCCPMTAVYCLPGLPSCPTGYGSYGSSAAGGQYSAPLGSYSGPQNCGGGGGGGGAAAGCSSSHSADYESAKSAECDDNDQEEECNEKSPGHAQQGHQQASQPCRNNNNVAEGCRSAVTDHTGQQQQQQQQYARPPQTYQPVAQHVPNPLPAPLPYAPAQIPQQSLPLPPPQQLPPPPPPPIRAPVQVPQPVISPPPSATQNLPAPLPPAEPEPESTYDEINQEHPEPQPPSTPVQKAPTTLDRTVVPIVPSSPLPPKGPSVTPLPPQQLPVAHNPYEGASGVPAAVVAEPEQSRDYVDDSNAVDSGNSLNCEDAELKEIVTRSLKSTSDNLDAARKIESEAAVKFGGRFNSIVSNSEFAYVNWYGKRNCQLRVNNRHSLTWED